MSSGILQVLLIDAEFIINKELLGKMDPYVLIKFGNEERKSSVAKGQGKKPVWNEKFNFKAEYPGQHKVIFRVMDKDTFSADDFIGESTIYIKDLLSQGVEVGKSELPLSKYRLVLDDLNYSGEIRIGITFTSKAEEEMEGDIGGWKQSFF
ncbi:PREDICTED: elicitor-responsive protein 1-like [Nelumbo nucifera]|uniref:C2 domain-containing protein n=2 Tax=Nelumbo nucifera TaxID=4432 RepID=A0A822Y2F0_NELNU|nr:PREDICTED: elicitor-responsive protein 1-like [Nelumbo nucifera]DAD26432.1 TPA_asm: hypothetical protein HUJ06_027900 [Nelumbo nucifera]